MQLRDKRRRVDRETRAQCRRISTTQFDIHAVERQERRFHRSHHQDCGDSHTVDKVKDKTQGEEGIQFRPDASDLRSQATRREQNFIEITTSRRGSTMKPCVAPASRNAGPCQDADGQVSHSGRVDVPFTSTVRPRDSRRS